MKEKEEVEENEEEEKAVCAVHSQIIIIDAVTK